MTARAVSDLVIFRRADQLSLDLADSSHLALFINDVVPTVETLLTDFVFASFSGYVIKNLAFAWALPSQQETGRWRVETNDSHTFSHNGGAISNTVYGWCVLKGSNVYLTERFEAPKVFEDVGDEVTIQPFFDVFESSLCGVD